MNDLAATAYEIPFLKKDEVITIKEGNELKEPERYVILAPGTGLGQAFLIYEGRQRVVIPSEGGHSDFAPTDEFEILLFRYLLKKVGHVSYERIISGSGIPNIFNFLIETNFGEPKEETLERMKIIIEPSSAVPLAAIIENQQFFNNKNVGIIISGGNVDLMNLPF